MHAYFGTSPTPRVVIVSDTLVQSGGAERVVEVFAEAFPDAPVLSVLYCPKNGPSSLVNRISESWLGSIPFARRFSKALLPFYPNAIESFDLSPFDIILSSHHTLAKGVLRTTNQTHICYCHTPMRSLWERPHDEVQRAPRSLRPLVRGVLSRLRIWDLATVSRVDRFISNSRTTQQRVAKHYGRESTVLNPPIDIDRFSPGGPVGDYFLVACRNVPYKRVDLAIAAAELAKKRLIIVGPGTDALRYQSRFVEFRGKVRDDELIGLMRGARALLFPQTEDFGMTAVEVNACGRPVIAYGHGGALETVVDGKTGLLFPEQTAEALAEAMERFEHTAFDSAAIRRHAERYSKQAFIDSIQRIVIDTHAANHISHSAFDQLESEGRRLALVGP